MFVRRHRLTIEIEQQTLRIHQRTASISVNSETPEATHHTSSNPESSDRESSSLAQSHHNSAFAIVPEAKTLALDLGHEGKLSPESIASHPPVIITITDSATTDSTASLVSPGIVPPTPQALHPPETSGNTP